MAASRILMGVIGRPHGVRGLVRVHSYTADPADLPDYGPFDDGAGRRFAVRWRGEGVAEILRPVHKKRIVEFVDVVLVEHDLVNRTSLGSRALWGFRMFNVPEIRQREADQGHSHGKQHEAEFATPCVLERRHQPGILKNRLQETLKVI